MHMLPWRANRTSRTSALDWITVGIVSALHASLSLWLEVSISDHRLRRFKVALRHLLAFCLNSLCL